MATSKVALRYSRARGWEDVIPAWEGPVDVGARTPPLGTGPVVTVQAIVSALDALAAQQSSQSQQDADPFPDYLNDVYPSCGATSGNDDSARRNNPSAAASHHASAVNLDNTCSSDQDFSTTPSFMSGCMVPSSHDLQDEWETATIVDNDVLTEGMPTLDYEDSDISISTSTASLDALPSLEAPSDPPAVTAAAPVDTSFSQPRSVFVAWQDAGDNMRRNIRLFLGPLAQNQDLWTSWGLLSEGWLAYHTAVNQDPQETDAHVASLIQAVQNAIAYMGNSGGLALHIYENQDVVIVVRSMELRPSSSLEVLVDGYAQPLVAMVQSGQCSSPSFWSNTFMIDRSSNEEQRLVEAATTPTGLGVIYDFLSTYLTRTSIRHWSEEALVNGLRVVLYPRLKMQSREEDSGVKRSVSINSLAGGPLDFSPPLPVVNNSNNNISDKKEEEKDYFELDLEHLFDKCAFLSEDEGDSNPSTTTDVADLSSSPAPVVSGRGKGLMHLQLARSLEHTITTNSNHHNTRWRGGGASQRKRSEADEKTLDLNLNMMDVVDDEGDRPHWRKARARRIKYYESDESEFDEKDKEDVDDDEEEEDEQFTLSTHRSRSTTTSRRPSTTTKKHTTINNNNSNSSDTTPKLGSLIHPPYDYPGRPTPVGKELADRGRHKCRVPGCAEDYRWPDYFCKIHGGGKCQYFWWDDSVEACPKFHQSRNSNGELLCGEHCRATGARYGESSRKGGKAGGGGGGVAVGAKKRKRTVKKKTY